MKSGLNILLLSTILTLAACAPNPNRVQTMDTHWHSSDGSHLVEADPDTVTFEQEVRGHLAMPEEEQEVVREMALETLKEYEAFEDEARNRHDSIYRLWYHDPAMRWSGQFQGVGLGNSLVALREVTEIDPSFVEAWTAQGRLANRAGDWVTALEYLDKALLTARIRQENDRPVDEDVLLTLYRERAWALRDLARWDEGLVAVREGLEFKPGDRDLVLIYGLLLAGAGRYEEAVSVAVRMPAIEFPHYNLVFYGLKKKPSVYANRWIRSQAMLAEGDYEGAMWVLGEMTFYPYTGLLVHSERFWRDVGLAAELSGDPKAGLYYSIGHVTREYWGYYPVTADALGELVLDVPDKYVPVFTSYGNRFYAGGSYLSYIGVQMNRMARTTLPGPKQDAAGRALQALEIAERRNIRPNVCRALRGRVYYYNDDFPQARTELVAARNAFKAEGVVDPGTSLLLGLLEMQAGRDQSAAKFLDEVVEAEPGMAPAWRSLGVVYDHLGLQEQALAAMDRAVDLEPRSVAGRYNRGLFHMQHGRPVEANEDLRVAAALDPDNREIQRVLDLAGVASPGSGYLEPADLEAAGYEDPDVLMTRLQEEVQAFFDQPDSLGVDRENLDASIREMERKYVAAPDNGTRKILALAYIDAGRNVEAQKLLEPGWGVDLEPDEEVMLLYVDHLLGERARAEDLASSLVVGVRSPDNPYAMAMAAMIIREDPRTDSSMVIAAWNSRNYGSARLNRSSTALYALYMRVGFGNHRSSMTHGNTYALPMPMSADPFFRALGSQRAGVRTVTRGIPTAGESK